MRTTLYRIKKKLTTPDYLRVLILRTVGNFLVISSLVMIVKTFYLPVREEVRFFVERITQKHYIVSSEDLTGADVNNINKILQEQPKGLLARAFNIQPVELLIPADPQFSIVVPKIGANAKILPNIDAGDENIYLDALNKGVAHALGTAFPGEGGHIFLFAHSTDYFWNVGTYNAIFYLLNKLEANDEINLFYQGKRYVYIVTGKTIVNPSQIEYITRKTNKELLTLQTCWPPGTTLLRLLVFATRKLQ